MDEIKVSTYTGECNWVMLEIEGIEPILLAPKEAERLANKILNEIK